MSLGSIRRRFAALRQVPSQVATAFAAWLEADAQARHDSGTAPDGEAWAPLKPSTLAKGRTPPPLDAFGNLRGSFYATPTANAGVVVGYTDGKAQYAQQGLEGERAPRPVVPDTMPAPWRAELARLIKEKVAGR